MKSKLRRSWKFAHKLISTSVATALLAITPLQQAQACTGITLQAQDGAYIFARTQEWGTFDLRSRVTIIPRNYALQTTLEDGKKGVGWKTKYGVVGLDVVEKDYLIDGMNEKGLTVNLFYQEGYTEYAKYDPSKAATSIPVLALAPYLLSNFQSIDEVRAAMAKLNVIGVRVEAIGGVPPVHLMVTDHTGKAVVIEFTNGITKLHDAPLGIVTNGPNYDWHINNLLNYTSLDVPLPHRKADDIKSLKFGAGARLFGLPGDLTSPSRFLRAAAYASTARKTVDGPETMYEAFRILDNFNLTVGTAAAEGGGEVNQEGMRSSTIWTTAYDTKNLVLQYHTQHNRRIRQLDFKTVNFDAKEVVRIPLDREKAQDIEYLNPSNSSQNIMSLAGGWSAAEVDQLAMDAANFAVSKDSSSAKLKRIIEVKKQVVKGANYFINYELDDGSVWDAIVYRDLTGEFSLKQSAKR
ncbi:linear amide C-N hydrolase [Chitinibacter bivalviorum]|uniref:Linear amide C-N hydrolase n=1 Tax=Chitinibacter bivalviorum TaxID=2739434 RepID=A0A7H9BJU5_9NEIS|nr:linear amide C-N hydrolase [Chitinibacter bivalviorum]QLG88749.1 linear amide C-N hydrolase [Chitinibacter bivalviorum]